MSTEAKPTSLFDRIEDSILTFVAAIFSGSIAFVVVSGIALFYFLIQFFVYYTCFYEMPAFWGLIFMWLYHTYYDYKKLRSYNNLENRLQAYDPTYVKTSILKKPEPWSKKVFTE